MFINLPCLLKPDEKNATKKLQAPHRKSKMRSYDNRNCLNGEAFLFLSLRKNDGSGEFDPSQTKQLAEYKYKKAMSVENDLTAY